MGTATEVVWDVHGPTPNPEWQRRLDQIAPPGLNIQSLHLYWEPGYAWQPIERWMVGRLWPRHKLPTYIERRWLDGPNPATLGYWDKKASEWVSLAPPISRRQWAVWQKTQCFMDPYWVVQGSGVGHKYRLSRQEAIVSALHGGQKDTPAPGELPYAEPDERMFGLLAQEDLVRKHLMGLNWVERNGGKQTPQQAALNEHMRDQVWNWLSQQAGEWAEQLSAHAYKDVWESAPVANNDPSEQAESLRSRMANITL